MIVGVEVFFVEMSKFEGVVGLEFGNNIFKLIVIYLSGIFF